jgi:hypothetical protein
MKAVFRSGTSSDFSGDFRAFPVGKRPEVTGKIRRHSGPEYCFHDPVTSGAFLPDTLIFPAGSDKDPLVSGGRNVRSGRFNMIFIFIKLC